jgi:hypothetical protein
LPIPPCLLKWKSRFSTSPDLRGIPSHAVECQRTLSERRRLLLAFLLHSGGRKLALLPGLKVVQLSLQHGGLSRCCAKSSRIRDSSRLAGPEMKGPASQSRSWTTSSGGSSCDSFPGTSCRSSTVPSVATQTTKGDIASFTTPPSGFENTCVPGDAPPCVTCGALMVPNGSCFKCVNCGSTSGCS